MTSGADAFARRRAESGGSYGQANFQAPGKVTSSGKGVWGSHYSSSGGGYNQGTQPQTQQSGNSASLMPLAKAVQGVEEASAISEHLLRCAAAAMDNLQASRAEVEAVLSKLVALLQVPVSAQATQLIASSPLPGSVVRTIKQFQDAPPCVSMACVVAARSSGSMESATAYIRAGALDEVNSLMDRHASHGGVQNVSLLMLTGLMKDHTVARQAVAGGTVNRILNAMELTSGREVQYNGLLALRLLLDSGRNSRAFLQDNPRAPRANLQEAALRAKVNHQSDNAVCNASNDVLALVTPRFKEVLCWHWQSGWCKLGPRCTYAHGQSDLRGDGRGACESVRPGKGGMEADRGGKLGCKGGCGKDAETQGGGKAGLVEEKGQIMSKDGEGCQKGASKGVGKGSYGKRGVDTAS